MPEIFLPHRNVILEFPDEMGDDEIKAAIDKEYPMTGEEVAGNMMLDPEWFSKDMSLDEYERYREWKSEQDVDFFGGAGAALGQIAGEVGSALVETFTSPLEAFHDLPSAAAIGTKDIGQLTTQIVDHFSKTGDTYKEFLDGKEDTPDRRVEYRNQLAEDMAAEQEKIKYFSVEREKMIKGEVPIESLYGLAEFQAVNPEFTRGYANFLDPSLFVGGFYGKALGRAASKVAAKTVGKSASWVGGKMARAGDTLGEIGEGITETGSRAFTGATGVTPETGRALAVGTGIGGGVMAAGAPVVAGAYGVTKGLQMGGRVLAEAGEGLQRGVGREGFFGGAAARLEKGSGAQRLAHGLSYGDPLLELGSGVAGGMAAGGVVGMGLGGLADGWEGAASGLGGGMALGGVGGGIARGVEGLSGVALREQRARDVQADMRRLPEDQAMMVQAYIDKHGSDQAATILDTVNYFRGRMGEIGGKTEAEVRFINEPNSDKRGFVLSVAESDGKPRITVNLGKERSDVTIGHELWHGLLKIEQIQETGIAEAIRTEIGGMWSEGRMIQEGLIPEAQLHNYFNDYVKKLSPEEQADVRKKHDTSPEKRRDYIVDEIAAEYMSQLVTGGEKGRARYDKMLNAFDSYTRSKIDEIVIDQGKGAISRAITRLSDMGITPGKSLLFPEMKKASPVINSLMRDMIRTRKNLDKAVIAMDETFNGKKLNTVIRKQDFKSKQFQKELTDLGLLKDDGKGGKVLKSDKDFAAELEKSEEAVRDILLKGGPDGMRIDTVEQKGKDTEVVRGTKFSDEQIQEIRETASILPHIKQTLIDFNSAVDKGSIIDLTYFAATKHITNRFTGKTSPRYSSGISKSRREVLPYKIKITNKGNFVVDTLNWTTLWTDSATQAASGKLKLWENSHEAFLNDFKNYLRNYASEKPEMAASVFGKKKAEYMHGLMEGGGRHSVVKSFRLDRVHGLRETGEKVPMSEQAWRLSKARFMPDVGKHIKGVGDPAENLRQALARKPLTGVAKNPEARFHDDQGRPIYVGASDVHGGKSFDAWIQENNSWITPEEVADFRSWYSELNDAFVKEFGKRDADKMMMSWLGAQQNASPLTALQNVFRVEDRLDGIDSGKKGGLADEKIESILKRETPKEGFGAKLSDFVDSGYLRKTRTYVGGDKRGGQPFVADVHTGRDSGHLDQQTLTRLIGKSKLGKLFIDNQPVHVIATKEKKVTAQGKTRIVPEEVEVTLPDGNSFKLKRDLIGSPSSTAYEGISVWGNNLTDYLNQIGYEGGGWTAAEVQAVGWMRLLRQYGLPESTVAEAFMANTHRISAEVNFDYGNVLPDVFPQFAGLPIDVQARITKDVLTQTTKDLVGIIGGSLRVRTLKVGAGYWEGAKAPSIQAFIMGSPEAAAIFRDGLAYVSEQAGTISVTFGKGGKQKRAVVFRKPDGSQLSQASVDNLINYLKESGGEKMLKGFSAHPTPDSKGMIAAGLTESSSKKVVALLGKWAEINKTKLDVEDIPAVTEITGNDWKAKPDGLDYLSEINSRGGSQKIRQLHDYRGRYFDLVEQAYNKHAPEALAQKSSPEQLAQGRQDFLIEPSRGNDPSDPRYMPDTSMDALPSGEGAVEKRVPIPRRGKGGNIPDMLEIRAALDHDRRLKAGVGDKLKTGDPVGLRIDIPAFERTLTSPVSKTGEPTYAISVHGKWKGGKGGRAGTVIGYENMVRVKDPVFTVNEKAAEGIKGGKPKTTIATVEGSYVKSKIIPEDIKSWTQAGMNPKRHSYFYDRATGEPVTGGSEALSIGGTVFVKDATFGSKSDFRFMPDIGQTDALGMFSAAERATVDLKQEKGSASQMLAMIKKAGVKDEELQALGLDKFLEGNRRVTKDEIIDHLVENSITVEETMLGKPLSGGEIAKLEPTARDPFPDAESQPLPTKHSSYVEPGAVEGSYRELLLRLPEGKEAMRLKKELHRTNNEILDLTGSKDILAFTPEKAAARVKRASQEIDGYKRNLNHLLSEQPNNLRGHETARKGIKNKESDLRLASEQLADLNAKIAESPRLQGLFAKLSSLESEHKSSIRKDYKGGHYGDTPNVLAHVRFNERQGSPEHVPEMSIKVDKDPTNMHPWKVYVKGSTNPASAWKTRQQAEKAISDAVARTPRERTLFIEEIQSDWHQEGRKKGYRMDAAAEAKVRAKLEGDLDVASKELVAYRNKVSSSGSRRGGLLHRHLHENDPVYREISIRRDDINSQLSDLGDGTVPDAPFKTSWHELAMKRLITYAVQNGYDAIAWTKGETQAARYDLSKQVAEIWYLKHEDGTYTFDVIGKVDDADLMSHSRVSADVVEANIGKDMLKNMDARKGKKSRGPEHREEDAKWFILKGKDLKVGGEGMKGFYDRMLPKMKTWKKLGLKVETGLVTVGKRAHEAMTHGWTHAEWVAAGKTPSLPAHIVKLTPEVKAKVLDTGIARFMPDTAVPGAERNTIGWSMLLTKSGNWRVYGPDGVLAGVAGSKQRAEQIFKTKYKRELRKREAVK